MVTSPGNAIFLLRAVSAIALSKQADQPAANSCSGLVPMRAEPGAESLTSRWPSELREAPFSRPPVVWVLAVYRTFEVWLMVHSLRGARSSFGDVDNGLGKSLRSFLRQVVSNAALDQPMRIPAREFLGVGTGLRMGSTVGVTFHGDGRYGDHRTCGQPFLQFVIFRLAFGQRKPPA